MESYQRGMAGTAELQLEGQFRQIHEGQLPHFLSEIPIFRGELLLPIINIHLDKLSLRNQRNIIVQKLGYTEESS